MKLNPFLYVLAFVSSLSLGCYLAVDHGCHDTCGSSSEDISGGQASIVDGGPTAPGLAPVGPALLTAGYGHACLLRAPNDRYCWGRNFDGEIGDGTLTSRHPLPTAVSGLPGPASHLRASGNRTCAIVFGDLLCWGAPEKNHFLPDGGFEAKQLVPTPLPTGLSGTMVDLARTNGTLCALSAAGAVKCYGGNGLGSLGSGSTATEAKTFQAVTGLASGVVGITGMTSLCAVKSDGTVWCWGSNTAGALGNGSMESSSNVPVQVSGLVKAVQVAAGGNFNCALKDDGTVRCWGHGGFGQLGGGTQSSSTPVQISTITGAVSIAVGSYHGCAVIADGGLRCWNRRLPRGTTSPRSRTVASLPWAASRDR